MLYSQIHVERCTREKNRNCVQNLRNIQFKENTKQENTEFWNNLKYTICHTFLNTGNRKYDPQFS